MPHRDLYLEAYDIGEPVRRSSALKLTRAFTTGGQKSVHEVFMTPGERQQLLNAVFSLLDTESDRFELLRLDPRSRVYTLGRASKPADPNYFYVG